MMNNLKDFIIQMSEREKIAIEYLKACGCKYIVRQPDGDIKGFTCEPYYEPAYGWCAPGSVHIFGYYKYKFECGIDISFIKEKEIYHI